MSGGSTMWSSTLIRIMSSLFILGYFPIVRQPYRWRNGTAAGATAKACDSWEIRRRADRLGVGDQTQRDRVDAVSLIRRRRIALAREHVTEMAVAVRAEHL